MTIAKSIVLLAGMTLCPSCTMVVMEPEALQTSSQDYEIGDDGRISINIRFNKPYDPNTVVVGKTLILVTEKVANAAGTWDPFPGSDTGIRFITTKKIGDLLIHDPDGYFTLKLIGSDTGNGAIKCTAGRPLDGDRNHVDGGDYKTTFLHAG